jgi:hypothetical protein
MNSLSKDYINRVADSKTAYHSKQAKIPFEEKVKIIVSFQKIDLEMTRINSNRKSHNRYKRLWDVCWEK